MLWPPYNVPVNLGVGPFQLTPQLLLLAYAQGIFPMAPSRNSGQIHWFCPDPRAVLPMDRFRIPNSLRRTLRQGLFDIRHDTAFEQVMRGCARPRKDDDDTWISNRIIDAYCQLHQLGFAHSIECWRNDHLQGGLYGVALGGAFFGESMFRDRDSPDSTNASKVALVATHARLHDRGFRLFDVQYANDHLEQFGVEKIRLDDYLGRLRLAIQCKAGW